ncbi:uncharacterized protein LOC110418331 [Herrania umbratica]|uniref:Uncharacterized protein LOC110418331 n=1 Tax=Herrania umbratica TaxID=108875 RepID=A0A6J1AIN8_9ROSI|nr:uncharacterized protein LOC110418331 [Herrania umbratica]
MAAQTFHHTRSNSFPLPTRPSPLVSQIDEHLNRLKASDATSTSSSISHKLNGLQDLYDSVDKLLQLPFSQALVQEQNKEWVNELLDGYLRLLDLCSTAKDFVLQTKENAHEIQSVLCRRRSGDFELVGEVRRFFISRKVLQKTIHKALRNLKVLETKRVFSPSDDHETTAMVSMLREVEQVTSSTFEYLLSLISGPKERSKPGSWLVSKVLHHKRTACAQAGRDINEFEKVDASLRLLVNQKMSKSENIINVEMQNQLKDFKVDASSGV